MPAMNAWCRLAWTLLAVYCLLLVTATHIPAATLEQLPVRLNDKLAHFVAYAGLGFLLATALQLTQKVWWWTIGMTITIGFAFAGLDEWTQQFVRRHADWFDVAADACGILIGLALFLAASAVHHLRTNRTQT
jgi:VanZ family protein